jgi:serine/threonine-protein kinase
MEPRALGRYLMFDAFARGGVASVHLGRLEASPGMFRIVAIKRLERKPGTAPDELMVERLLEEARLLFRVRHPCVVPTLDVIREPGHDGEVALVLEYVHGVSLAALSSEAEKLGEPIPASVVVAIVADALRGLHAAHATRAADGSPLGIIHRDVSPQNIVVSADGVGRLVDFGIAKALGRQKLTVTGTTLGKVVYMAPEQLKALPLTPQADLYSAGVVAWECLTGRSFTDALEQKNVVPAPSAMKSDLPKALDAIVLKAIARDTKQRYTTGEEMAAALEDACTRASASEVARLVERLGCDELERRAELIAKVESYVAPIPEPDPVPVPVPDPEPVARLDLSPSSPPPASTQPVSWVPPTEARSSRPLTFAAAGLVVAAVVVLMLSLFRARTQPEPIAVAPKPSAPARAAIAQPETPKPVPPPIAALDAELSPPQTVVLDEEATGGRFGVKAPIASAPRPRSTVKVSRPVARAEALDCDPPFRIDERGNKRYKTECLR